MSSPLTAHGASLRLTPELAENIRQASVDGLKALSRRGAEIGGLITAAPSLPSLAVDFTLVRFEYACGLSENDISRLRDAAEQCRKEGKRIAAYFRGSARSNGVVDADDRRAIAEACPEAAFAVIARSSISGGAHIRIFRAGHEDQWTVVRELNVPAPVAAIYSNGADKSSGEDAPVVSDAPVTAVPPIAAGARQPQDALQVLEDVAPPIAPPIVDVPRPEGGSKDGADPAASLSKPFVRQRRRTPVLVFAVTLILAGVVLVAKLTGSRPQTSHVASHETGLGLAVRQEAGQLHLTWSRNSPAARTATSGVLQIQDGASPVSIRLAASELAEGSLVYTPRSQDVTFQLRLGARSGSNVEETIRVIGTTRAPRTEAPTQTAKISLPAPRREAEPKAPQRPGLSNAPPTVRTDSRSVSPMPVLDNTPQPPAAPPNNPKTTQRQTAQVQAPQINPPQPQPPPSQPPQVQPAQTQIAQTTLPSETTPQSALRPDPTPALTVPSVPAPLPPAALSAASPASGNPVGYPTPLRRVEPTLSGTHWKVTETTKLDILVTVDARGFVSDARPQSVGKGNMFLEGLCLSAARQWTFKPATVGGKPVAGRYLIEFVFRP